MFQVQVLNTPPQVQCGLSSPPLGFSASTDSICQAKVPGNRYIYPRNKQTENNSSKSFSFINYVKKGKMFQFQIYMNINLLEMNAFFLIWTIKFNFTLKYADECIY